MARECYPAVATSRQRCSGRGTGVVRTTGSCEGSPAERRHSGSSRGGSGHAGSLPMVSASSSRSPTRATSAKSRGHGHDAALAKAREAWDRPGRDRSVRGSIASAPWEDNAHAPDKATRPSSGDQRSMTIRRSGPGRRETSGPPVNPAEPKTPWGVPAAQAASASREHTRCGYTSFVWVADIGWTHRAPFPPRGRKTSWCSKGASQEEVRSSV